MGDRKATLTAVLVDAVSGPAKKIQAEITGIGTTAGKVSSILQGIGQGIGEQLFSGFETGFRTLTEAIPKVLDLGHSYLDQLHDIQLETGMTAEETSTLVGVMKNLGVPTEDLDVLFARLGANLGKNEGLFRQLGVATRDTNGAMLGGYAIVENIRKAVQEHGEALLTTSAAQALFGRSGFRLLEYFHATDAEIKAASDNFRRWGGVVSQSAIDGAHALKTTLGSLAQGVTDIGVNIAAAVDPYLRAFVDSFAKFVQSHLNEIVTFAVGVVNAVTGFVSGLFGITSALNIAASGVDSPVRTAGRNVGDFGKILKGAAAGSNSFIASLNAQIKAIDAHSRALEVASQRRQAARQREQLSQSLADAQAQLADLRGNAPFTEGLSNSEQQLAIQKHAQDVINAENDVADKRKALGDFAADQKDRAERELLTREKGRLQDLLATTKAHDAAIKQSGLQAYGDMNKGVTAVLSNLGIKSEQFASTAKSAFQGGIDAARGFLDILLGTEHVASDRGEGTFRTGGVVGAIQSTATSFTWLSDVIVRFAGFIADVARNMSTVLPAKPSTSGGWSDFFWGPGGSPEQAAQDFWSALIHTFSGGILPGPAKHASGGVFDTLGPTRIGGGIMGEAGGETVAILSHPRSAVVGGGGPTHTINVHFDLLVAPSKDQIRNVARMLFDEIDERMAIKADNAPVGMRAFRGANG